MKIVAVVVFVLCGTAIADLSRAVETYLAAAGDDRLVGTEEPAVERSQGWRYRVSLILWTASLKGAADVAGTTVPVDIPFSETLEKLEFAANTRISARKGRWAFVLEMFFLNIRDSQPGPMGTTVFSKTRWFFAELSVNYALLVKPLAREGRKLVVSGIAGARFHHVNTEVGIRGGSSPSATKELVDPLVGVDIRVFLGKWLVIVRGDIGGFGVDTEMTWRAFAAVERQISERSSVGLGYALLDIDRDDGAGGNRLDLDIRAQGAAVYFVFGF